MNSASKSLIVAILCLSSASQSVAASIQSQSPKQNAIEQRVAQLRIERKQTEAEIEKREKEIRRLKEYLDLRRGNGLLTESQKSIIDAVGGPAALLIAPALALSFIANEVVLLNTYEIKVFRDFSADVFKQLPKVEREFVAQLEKNGPDYFKALEKRNNANSFNWRTRNDATHNYINSKTAEARQFSAKMADWYELTRNITFAASNVERSSGKEKLMKRQAYETLVLEFRILVADMVGHYPRAAVEIERLAARNAARINRGRLAIFSGAVVLGASIFERLTRDDYTDLEPKTNDQLIREWRKKKLDLIRFQLENRIL